MMQWPTWPKTAHVGTDGSRFSPNGTLTRAMLSQILYAMEDKPAVSGAATFSDVAARRMVRRCGELDRGPGHRGRHG